MTDVKKLEAEFYHDFFYKNENARRFRKLVIKQYFEFPLVAGGFLTGKYLEKFVKEAKELKGMIPSFRELFEKEYKKHVEERLAKVKSALG